MVCCTSTGKILIVKVSTSNQGFCMLHFSFMEYPFIIIGWINAMVTIVC